MARTKPHIVISLGDPGGIGPETIVKALAAPTLQYRAHFTIIGAPQPLQAAAVQAGLSATWPNTESTIHVVDPCGPVSCVHRHNAAAGEASYLYFLEAIRRAKLPVSDPDHASAIVTGPISKEAWALAGHKYPGHTELLAEQFGVSEFGMFFYSPKLKVILVTTHIPLQKVPAALTVDRVLRTIRTGNQACKDLGIAHPRIAVCGLNPHAGENGLLGSEDAAVIALAITAAQAQSISASGPHPGDTIFNAAVEGRFDLVVAMYHDQGLIPVKLLARDSAVNVTVGLPTIRTSPDHGTAFDIAGQNRANPGSMLAAIELAIQMSAKRL